ncbi:hypothetical protein A2642_03480 [Candidatus Nomurabacteria bacterium RIFCSPHIGHO2_01_FULL_39_10]|uniref:Uncharacterized protein n=1 Tax=Candidatus Nomurabacteria bacterium RIFCSPHIGHO2_01_FULL_39_10 TaxID=1801733 RepID=A0A1F6V978_9BACT|nr:MAG: hypothetical protein A2642_03480 [Candidatus Nomurabacteria bacterium RIFCSPHIGHO2_01_FULL_39_10]
MKQRNPTEYIREQEFLALRNVSNRELTELYQLLAHKLGQPEVISAMKIPGGIEHRLYKTPEVDDPTSTTSWTHTWKNTSEAGQIAYIMTSGTIHQTIEAWGKAKPNHQHITAYLRFSPPQILENSLR